jgi:glycosyltransferase involved in cell wall biosynthesis
MEMLKEALHSILSQSFKNFEIIIGNDYIEKKITYDDLDIKNDKRVRIINNTSNLGEFGNMNNILRIANSEWFTWMADDDLMHYDFLKSGINSILNHKNSQISAYYCNYQSGKELNLNFQRNKEIIKPIILDFDNFCELYTQKKIKLLGCYGIINTNYLKSISGHPQLGNSFGPYSDTLLPFLLFNNKKILWSNSKLIYLRTHQGSQSASSSDLSAYTTAETDFINRFNILCNEHNIKKNDKDKYILNLVKWFAADEFNVLMRNNNFSIVHKIVLFFKYQLRVNLKRLKISNYINFTIYSFWVINKALAIKLIKKLLLG